MALFLVVAVMALSNAGLVASQQEQTTWGSVVMMLHGERTPGYSDAYPNLTPLGAQQSFRAGSVMRTRYIQGPDSAVTKSFPIKGISMNAINNNELYILSADEDYTAASAQAFMQGLYPPLGVAYVDDESIMSNGSLVQFPLGGYQYSTIDTISPLDFNYVWIAGDNDCNQYALSANNYVTSQDYNETAMATLPLYHKLIPIVFQRALPKSLVNYYNAYNLWDYANYQYLHNKTVYNTMSASDLAQLRTLASQHEFARNGNTSAFGLTPGDKIRTIAGQTYAGHVLSLLGQNMGSRGNTKRMSMLFGNFRVFLSFFALSGLSQHGDNFKSIPEPGSVMVFEMFSNTENATMFPDPKDLWVRFLFRNGTNESTPLLSYPLFGRGNSAVDMPWIEFQNTMDNIGLSDLGTWCETCGSLAMYCPQFEDNMGSGGGKPLLGAGSSSGSSVGLSPTIAGVLGAVVTIATFMLVVAAAFLCCGIRFYRKNNKRQSSLGGFKGAEKLASDTDLTVAKSGAGATVVRHERVGSWELSEATKKGEEGAQGASMDRVVSMADYGTKHDDDGISVIDAHGEPVKADDRI